MHASKATSLHKHKNSKSPSKSPTTKFRVSRKTKKPLAFPRRNLSFGTNVDSTNSDSIATKKSQSRKHKTLGDFPINAPPESLFRQSFYYVENGLFKHHGFPVEQMKQVAVSHRPAEDLTDRVALGALRAVRKCFDLATGYKHPPKGEESNPKYKMTTKQWMFRFIFLESVAGVPGLIGGMLRHLQSIRLLRRDNGWMESLLEEAYNERMHLLSFLEMYKPGPVMKLSLLGAQGVFCNAFFLAYLCHPRLCHRFVGYLEEEAVVTYTRCLNEIENGMYPEWETQPAPSIALKYWHMPEGSTVKDMLYYVRADECKHREVNHTFANLHQGSDPNPYAMKYDESFPHPSFDLNSNLARPCGWKRDEIVVDAALNPDSPAAQQAAAKY